MNARQRSYLGALGERIARLNLYWVQAEQGVAGAETELARDLHTLKGEASLLGLEAVARGAHEVEEQLAGGGARDGAFGDRVLDALDRVAKLAAPSAEVAPRGDKREAQVLRVASTKLDRLRETVGEALLVRARLHRTAGDLRRASQAFAPSAVDPGARMLLASLAGVESTLRAGIHQLAALIEDLEETTHDLRMIRVGELLETLPVEARNVARSLDRQIHIEIHGDEVEVERTVLTRLAVPLVHLVRNAIDHGIEPPEVRERAGKPVVGTIRVGARVQDRRLVIDVADDGAGVDVAAVRARAIEVGLLDAATAYARSDSDLLELLFAARLSTRRVASEISGRGLGLDAVRASLEALGGTVRLDSVHGAGTTITLTAPLSLAVSTILTFRVGLGCYAVPSSSVVRLIDESEAVYVAGSERRLATIDGVPARVVRLAQLLDESQRERRSTAAPRLLLVRSGDELIALADTTDHEQRQSVLKFSAFLERLPTVTAAAPLEDGTLALVLRTSGVAAAASAPGFEPAARVRTILVVEDSPVVRDLVAEALRAHGLHVREASDGEEARTALEADADVDLVLTDLEMPRLDGFGLIRWIRGRPGARVPIVVLSMRGSDHDKRTALAAGADGYLVKSDISHAGLWAAISRHLVVR